MYRNIFCEDEADMESINGIVKYWIDRDSLFCNPDDLCGENTDSQIGRILGRDAGTNDSRG